MFDIPHITVGVLLFGVPLAFFYLAVKIVREAWK